MNFMFSARPVNVSAAGTGLARISRVYLEEGAATSYRFVQELLLEVIVSPAHLCIAVSDLHTFRGSPDPGQVLEDEERTFRITADECLRYTMVHIVHPTVFSLPDGTDPASRGGRLPFLELTAEFFVMGPLLFDRRAGIEGSLLSVIDGSNKADAPVYPNDLFVRRGCRRVRDVDRHGNMEEKLVVFEYQFRCTVYGTFSKGPVHSIRTEGAFDPPLERIDTE